MAITESIPANLGPLIIILLQLVFIYLLCHLLGLTDSLGLLFGGLTHCQQYLRYINIKVAFHGIIFPNDLLGLGKCNYCSMAFLTMIIKYLLELFREIYRTIYGTFLERCSTII